MTSLEEVLHPKLIKPTAEQEAIIEAAINTTDNLLLNALAGAAKTSTLVMIAEALPSSLPILSLAFNKRIAEEMKTRLPGNVMCKTLNAIGHGVWAQTIARRRIVVSTKKSYEILKSLVDDLKRSDRTDAYDTFSETLKLIGSLQLATLGRAFTLFVEPSVQVWQLSATDLR